MKKFFTLTVFSLLLALVTTTSLKAQNEVYWREGFTNNPGNLISASGSAPTVPTVDTADNGLWVLFNTYRTTGSPCTGYETGHIRSIKTAAGSGIVPYVITPKVDFGIKEFHFSSSGNNKPITIEKTSSLAADNDAAAIAASTWTPVGIYTRTSCTAGGGDTTIMINDATATRIRILSKENFQVDIDSVWLTSVIHITPVKFASISAINANGINKISWTSETEINTNNYVIERSADGIHFTQVGMLAATGATKYVWMDNAPLNGNAFYRVKGIDQTGAFNLSTIVKTNITMKAQDLSVAPNPVRNGQLNLQMNNFSKGQYTVNIFNDASQKVFTKVLANDGGTTSQLVQLPATLKSGVYNLQLLGDAVKMTKRLVVE